MKAGARAAPVDMGRHGPRSFGPWLAVAKLVPGKTAQQCQARLSGDRTSVAAPGQVAAPHGATTTTAATKRKAASNAAAAGGAAPGDDAKPRKRVAKAGATVIEATSSSSSSSGSSSSDSDEENGDFAKVRVAVTGHKGTLKRRRQLRQLLQEVRASRDERSVRDRQRDCAV